MKSDGTLVSVIIPFYDNKKYLKKCLVSVLNSTYKNLEVIIVNDGSREDISDILADINDKRIKYFYQDNKGVSAARNAGLERAKGDFILFADPDDIVIPNIIEKCVNALNNHEFDAAVFGYVQKVEIDGEVVEERIKIPEKELYCCNNFNEILIGPIRNMYGIPSEGITSLNRQEVQSYKRFSSVWCWCYRKENLKKYNISFRENLVLYEDGMFNCEYLMHSKKIIAISNIGYEYFFRGGQQHLVHIQVA